MAKTRQAPQGKAYDEHRPRQAPMSLDEAVKLIKESSGARRSTRPIEISMNLGIDPRHADQNVRGVVTLPNGTGKSVRVAVFAKAAQGRGGDFAAGADLVGADDLSAEKVQAGRDRFRPLYCHPGHDASGRASWVRSWARVA